MRERLPESPEPSAPKRAATWAKTPVLLALGALSSMQGCMVPRNQPMPGVEQAEDPMASAVREISKKTGMDEAAVRVMLISGGLMQTKRIDAETGEDVNLAASDEGYNDRVKYPEVSIYAGKYAELTPEQRAVVDAVLASDTSSPFTDICRQIKGVEE